MLKRRYFARLAGPTLTFCLAVSAFGAVGEAQRIKRLEMLADVWGKLYLFHPRIVTSAVDWNRVLIETIPKAEKAANTDELIAVLNASLFRPLDDPFTLAQKAETVAPGRARKLSARRLLGNTGYIDATDPREYGSNTASRIGELIRDLGPIKVLIVDLRFAAPQPASLDWLRMFLDSPQTRGAQVSRVHEGWNENNRIARDIFQQRWNVSPGSDLEPLENSPALPFSTAFVVNNSSYSRTVEVLDVLQASKGTAVILETRGRFLDASRDDYPEHVGVQLTARYPENIEIQLNTSMLLTKSGSLGPQPDYVTSAPIREDQLAEIAARLLQEPRSRKSSPPFTFAMNFPVPEPVSSEPIARERRLLGLFKIWTVTSYLNLHLQHASIDWSTVLPEWIPKVEAAGQDQGNYYRALRGLIARLNDSHVRISLANPSRRLPRLLPAPLQPVEGKPVVVATVKGPSGEELPLRAGDEILAIDGRSVEEIFAEHRPFISASTPGALLRDLVNSLRRVTRSGWPDLIEKDSEEVEVVFQNDTGKHTAIVPTVPPDGYVTAKDGTFQRAERTPNSPVSYKILEMDLGYINLDTLTDAEIEPAFSTVGKTKGLILDMRGYPQVSYGWRLPFLFLDQPVLQRSEIPVASMSSPITSHSTSTETVWRFEPKPPNHYAMPIVVLIDARAQSNSEAFCQTLRDARRATFVGSTTAGAGGNGSPITLPGGQKMYFSAMRMKFADGSPFQNVGIVPDVKAEPTIRGIRTGRDEVLEKGIETLKSLIAR